MSAPKRREPHRKMRRIRISVCRRSASPSFGGKTKASGEWWIGKRNSLNSQLARTRNSDADRVVRTRSLVHRSVEGAAGSRRLAFSLQEILAARRTSEYARTSRKLCARVSPAPTSAAPSRRPSPSTREGREGADEGACAKPPRRVRDRHAAFRRAQRHDQGRAPCRAQPQARSRRDRAFAGVAQGAAQFRHRRRSPRRADRLRGTGQGAAGLRLSRRGRRRASRHRQESSLDRRSARRHHQFPARHPAFRGVDRARARRRHRRRPHLQSGQRGAVHRRARQGRVPQRPAHPGRGARAPGRRRGRLRHAALRRAAIWRWRATKSPPRNKTSPDCAVMAQRRSISPGSPPAGSMPIGSAICRRGISPPG